jgi:RHS repeat-associated protein
VDGLVPHATAGNQSWSRSYTYDDSGNITNIGDQQFVYDALGRLSEMATAGTATETYEYDRYGNQTKRTSGGVEHPIATDTATNRLSTGYSYDPGGNVTSGNSYTLTYDALGQAATTTYAATTTFNETYIYTAAEERIGVQTSNSSETTSWLYWSVRDEGGKVLRQYRSSALDPTQTALWIEDYVYRDGMLVGAERPPTLGGRRHFHLDHLGSPRLITSNDGQIVSSHDYLPFGGETTSINQETSAGFDREDPMKFTGHERDYAGGYGREVGGDAIDYMHARYYSPSAGRFLAIDPKLDLDDTQRTIKEPQRWNRYIYALNAPLNYTDMDGREVTITIKRDVYTDDTVTSTMTVTSDVKGVAGFNGFTLETTHAGDKADKDPIPAGAYDAKVRTDHDPNRVELENVKGFANVQMHVGNTKDDVKGCFAVGSSRDTDKVEKSKAAMASILAVIDNDKSGIIKVTVVGSSTKPVITPTSKQPVAKP